MKPPRSRRPTLSLRPRLRRMLASTRGASLSRWAGDILRSILRRQREGRNALTVAVDAASLFEPLTGIGGYLYRLLTHLADHPDLRLRLYGPEILELPGGMEAAVEMPSGPAIEWVRYPSPTSLGVSAGVAARLAGWMQRLAPALVAADGNRVLFAPNYLPPPSFRLSRGALVATIHDLSVERLPWAVRPDSRRALVERLERTFREAAQLITDTETVRREIIAAGHFPPHRITAIHLGPGQVVAHNTPREAPADLDPYALAVGTLEPRKNLTLLLAVWPGLRRRLREHGHLPPRLVLVGRYGWKTAAIRRAAERGLRDGWLLHLEGVSSEELIELYLRATVVAFPTLYEGFGLPALEAMSLGVPLVASDLPVLREVAADAPLYARADDPDSWLDHLEKVFTDPTFALSMARRGEERARHFSWPRTASETVAVWRRATSEKYSSG